MTKKNKPVFDDFLEALIQILFDSIRSKYEDPFPQEIQDIFNQDLDIAATVLNSFLTGSIASLLYEAHQKEIQVMSEDETPYEITDYEINRIFKLAVKIQNIWDILHKEASYLAKGNENIKKEYIDREYIEDLENDSGVLNKIENKDPKLLN